MLCNYEYYQSEYLGNIVPAEQYAYLAERAQDILEPYIPVLSDTDAAKRALRRCSCALCEELYGEGANGSVDGSTATYGAPVASETISGYYSVTYGLKSDVEKAQARTRIIHSFLAPYITRAVRAVY